MSACGINEIAPGNRRDVKIGRATSTKCTAGRPGDQDNPPGSKHCQMRAFDRDLIRGGHYSQWSCDRTYRPNTWPHRPMLQNMKKVLASPEPSTHDPGADMNAANQQQRERGHIWHFCSFGIVIGRSDVPRTCARHRRLHTQALPVCVRHSRRQRISIWTFWLASS
jgi:hypothetical protein